MPRIRFVVLAAAAALCQAGPVSALNDESGPKVSVSAAAFGGIFNMEAEFLEAHRQRPDPDAIDPSYIIPSNVGEANTGIRYFASHFSAGPRVQIDWTGGLSCFGQVSLASTSISTTFSRDVVVSHPPSTILLPRTERETTRLDEGVEFSLGARLSLKAAERLYIGGSYSISYGVSKMHAGSFFLAEMQGEYSYFIHRIGASLELRLPVEGFGSLKPGLGLGAMLYRSKAEFEQREGTEDWRMEWIQASGLAVEVGIRIESGRIDAGLSARLFGERSVSMDIGVRF